MLELPPHHVPRQGLREALSSAPVVVVEAASGFGKSTFAAELTRTDRVASVTLTDQETGRHALLLPLRRALRRVGESDAASALGELATTPVDALDAMCDALDASPPLTIVVDDAHHLDGEAALLTHLVTCRPSSLRLVVSARALPPAATRLRTMPGVEHVDAAALRFDDALTAHLLGHGFGIEVDDGTVTALTAATDGWPAALAFVGAQMQRSPSDRFEGVAADSFSSLVLGALPREVREVAAQLAHLPWLDADLADAATGRPEALRALVDAGVPLAMGSDGTHRLPGALADVLARTAPLDLEVARRAAGHHLDRGQPFDALAVLRRARDWDRLASLLADLPPQARSVLTADELISTLDALPDAAVRAHPEVLIELARASSRAGIRGRHDDVLDRAARLVEGRPPAFARAVEVQQLQDGIFVADREESARRVAAVLDEAGSGEEPTIARALVLHGVLRAWAGQHDEARRALRRAAATFVERGEPYEASRALVHLGFNVDLHGDLRAAERTFEEAVALAGNDARSRATALTYLGEIRVWLGRPDEGVRDLRAASSLARAVRDTRAQGYAAWGLALLASLQGDRERTVAQVREAERLLAAWTDTGVGATFVATMVDLLDRAGAHDEADTMLERARERRAEEPELVALAEFVVAARRGDPAEAERLWPTIEADDGIELFERVRCRFLRAHAALRRDAPEVERLHREAVADAEAIGLPDLPAHLEPVAAAALAARRDRGTDTWEVRCLGPLSVRHHGVEVALPPGRPSLLVGLLAASDGPLRISQVVDLLWPEVAETDGRARLRQVLYRLRTVADVVVRRGGDQLALGETVRTDLDAFARHVTVAGAGGPRSHGAAREAVELYRGELLAGLPLDPDAGDLAVVRERLRVRFLGLLDQLTRIAEADHDTDAAIDWATRAHEHDVADERRAVRLARLLATVGRETDADVVLADTSTALRQLGVAPTAAFLRVARRVRRSDDELDAIP